MVGPYLSLGSIPHLLLGVVGGLLIGYSLAAYFGLSLRSRWALATIAGVLILPLSVLLRVVAVREVPIPPVGFPLCIGGYGFLVGAISGAMARQRRLVGLLLPLSCFVGLFVGSFVAIFAGYFLYSASEGGLGGILAGGVAGAMGGVLAGGTVAAADELVFGQLGWSRT